MEIQAELEWNGQSGLGFTAWAANGLKLEMDALESDGGDGEGFSPKILLLMALGGCTAMVVLPTLRKMRQEVIGYRLEIKGRTQTEPPTKFSKIEVEHIFSGRGLKQALVDKALQLAHEKYCSVAASLHDSIEIVMTSRLVEIPTATESS